MNALQALYLVTSIFVGFLAYFVYSKNHKSKPNVYLASFATVIAVWLFCSFIALCSRTKSDTEFWFKMGYTGVVFIPSTVYAFVVSYLKINKHKYTQIGSFIFSVIFAVLIWSGSDFLNGLNEYSWGLYPKAGTLHPFFLIGFIIILTWMYIFLFSHYLKQKKEDPSNINQKKIIYVLWALIASNLSSVDFFGNYGFNLFPLGFFFMTAMVGIFTYAILNYQLLDIEVIVRRTAVFAGLFAFVYGVFTIVTIIGQEFFKSTLGWNQWIATIPTVLIITFSLRPLELWLTNATEQFLFQKKYDYRILLKTFTNEILTVLDLQKLADQTVAGLIKIIKLESAAVLLKDKETKSYRLVASVGAKDKSIVIKEEDVLIKYLQYAKQHILQDKTAESMDNDGEMKQTFKKLNAKICLPIELHDELIGILCLGMKKSGEDYTQEDIDILTTLSRTEAIAISNAQLFDELSKTQAEAAQREKMAVIGTLAAGINHEICNPLGIVRGQCEMFLLNAQDGFYKTKSTEEMLKISEEIMNKVIKETDRATAITKKLSSFAKPSKRSEMEEVYADKEVDEVIGLLEHDMRLNNIVLKKAFPPSFPPILADKKQIQEVMFNLIRNAAQAMDKKDGRITISGMTQNGNVIVEITDNGTGIPPDKLTQIFHPFYTTKAPGKGTGLGLFIVKQVVERNKGEITLTSELGVGTSFHLKFPQADMAMAKNAA